MLRALFVVAVLSTTAVADPIFQLGVGVRRHLSEPETETNNELTKSSVGFEAVVAFPLTPTIALGIRAGISTQRESRYKEWGMQFYDEYRYRELPLEAGVVVLKRFGRLTLAPWLGVHTRRETEGMRVCGPFGTDYPDPDCESDPFNAITDKTNWTFRPAVGGNVTIDIARVSGAMIGASLHGQYVTDFATVGLELVVRI